MFSKSLFTVIVLSTAGVSAGLLLYMLYKRNDDDFIRREGHRFRSKCIAKLPVPQKCVSAVIGRGGSKINDIQSMTNTYIHFEDDNEKSEFRMLVIRGTSEGAQLAKCLIEGIMRTQPEVETYEMLVPHQAGGRIIGRHGITIRSITHASNAEVLVGKSEDFADDTASIKVKIIGTAEQIQLAKSLIEEKVNEELEMRQLIQEGKQRWTKTSNATADSESENNDEFSANERDDFMKVYTSE